MVPYNWVKDSFTLEGMGFELKKKNKTYDIILSWLLKESKGFLFQVTIIISQIHGMVPMCMKDGSNDFTDSMKLLCYFTVHYY